MLYYYPSHREKVEQVRFLAELKGESVFTDIHPYALKIQAQSKPDGRLVFPQSYPQSATIRKKDATHCWSLFSQNHNMQPPHGSICAPSSLAGCVMRKTLDVSPSSSATANSDSIDRVPRPDIIRQMNRGGRTEGRECEAERAGDTFAFGIWKNM